MRRLNAHGYIDPGSNVAATTPVCPTTLPPQPRRRRGRRALAELASTEDFTNNTRGGKLGPDACTLMLFCLVCLEDDDGVLTTAYRKLISAHGVDPGHWCDGLDLDALRRNVSKILGKGADRLPKWCQIADLFTAALPASDLAKLLPQAAALYCRATGEERPSAYAGAIVAPDWIGPPVVSTADIRAAVAAQRATLSPVTGIVPRDLAPIRLDADVGTERAPRVPREHDTTEMWSVLQDVVRAYRAEKTDNDQLRARVCKLETVTFQLTRENHALEQAATHALHEHGMSPADIRHALYRMGPAENALSRLPRHRNGWTVATPRRLGGRTTTGLTRPSTHILGRHPRPRVPAQKHVAAPGPNPVSAGSRHTPCSVPS